MKKIDLRRNYLLVLDVETIGVDEKLVFDIGFIVADKKGNKYERRSYLVEEVFTDMAAMSKAYYFKKYPTYVKELAAGVHTLEKWEVILMDMYNLIKEYKITTVMAYNLQFDLSALQYTNNALRGREFKMFDNLIKQCIWGLSVQTICQQKTFKRQIMERELLTASKKFMSTSAETVYKYITQNWDFVEAHQGLKDVEIEVDIMAKCYAQHKKHDKGIIAQPFRLAKID